MFDDNQKGRHLQSEHSLQTIIVGKQHEAAIGIHTHGVSVVYYFLVKRNSVCSGDDCMSWPH